MTDDPTTTVKSYKKNFSELVSLGWFFSMLRLKNSFSRFRKALCLESCLGRCLRGGAPMLPCAGRKIREILKILFFGNDSLGLSGTDEKKSKKSKKSQNSRNRCRKFEIFTSVDRISQLLPLEFFWKRNLGYFRSLIEKPFIT